MQLNAESVRVTNIAFTGITLNDATGGIAGCPLYGPAKALDRSKAARFSKRVRGVII